jgi:Integrase core domain
MDSDFSLPRVPPLRMIRLVKDEADRFGPGPSAARALIESFNGRLRDDLLNETALFRSLSDARVARISRSPSGKSPSQIYSDFSEMGQLRGKR